MGPQRGPPCRLGEPIGLAGQHTLGGESPMVPDSWPILHNARGLGIGSCAMQAARIVWVNAGKRSVTSSREISAWPTTRPGRLSAGRGLLELAGHKRVYHYLSSERIFGSSDQRFGHYSPSWPAASTSHLLSRRFSLPGRIREVPVLPASRGSPETTCRFLRTGRVEASTALKCWRVPIRSPANAWRNSNSCERLAANSPSPPRSHPRSYLRRPGTPQPCEAGHPTPGAG